MDYIPPNLPAIRQPAAKLPVLAQNLAIPFKEEIQQAYLIPQVGYILYKFVPQTNNQLPQELLFFKPLNSNFVYPVNNELAPLFKNSGLFLNFSDSYFKLRPQPTITFYDAEGHNPTSYFLPFADPDFVPNLNTDIANNRIARPAQVYELYASIKGKIGEQDSEVLLARNLVDPSRTFQIFWQQNGNWQAIPAGEKVLAVKDFNKNDRVQFATSWYPLTVNSENRPQEIMTLCLSSMPGLASTWKIQHYEIASNDNITLKQTGVEIVNNVRVTYFEPLPAFIAQQAAADYMKKTGIRIGLGPAYPDVLTALRAATKTRLAMNSTAKSELHYLLQTQLVPVMPPKPAMPLVMPPKSATPTP